MAGAAWRGGGGRGGGGTRRGGDGGQHTGPAAGTRTLLAVLALCGVCRAQGVSLTSGGFPAAAGVSVGAPPSSQSSAGTTLVATLNFGDLSPRAYSSKVRVVLPVRVSASTPYRVTVQRAGPEARGGLRPADVGFGVGNFRPQQPSGARLRSDALSGIVPAATFASDPSSAHVAGGQPRFSATLEQVSDSAPTVVFNGPATVADHADLGTDRGSILADLSFVVVPQYFTPSSSFDVVLIINISPNP